MKKDSPQCSRAQLTLGSFSYFFLLMMGFSGSSDGEECACNARNLGLIPGLGRSPGEENGYLLQKSCWRIAWTEEPGSLQSLGSQKVRYD